MLNNGVINGGEIGISENIINQRKRNGENENNIKEKYQMKLASKEM
jgi:hypothetical protein